MKNYITPKGYRLLNERINGLEEKLAKTQKQIGQACSESAESWHDNAAYDYLVYEMQITNKMLSDAYKDLNFSEIVQYPTKVTNVCIGCEVEVFMNGEKVIYRVLGAGESNPDGDVCEISYQAPIAQALFGKKIGDYAIFRNVFLQIIGLQPINNEGNEDG